MLYEATVMTNLLQTVRQKIRVPFSKGQNSKTVPSVEVVSNIFYRIVLDTITQ